MTPQQAKQRMEAVIAIARSSAIKIKYDLSKLTKEDWLAIRFLRRKAAIPGGYDASRITAEDWQEIRQKFGRFAPERGGIRNESE